MPPPTLISTDEVKASDRVVCNTAGRKRNYEALIVAVYGLAMLASFAVWLLAIRAPLWLDETGSYWTIAGGFRQIWARSLALNSFPAYYYVLWLTDLIFGSREIVLRIPSLVAMTASAYMVYRCAREWFARDVALIAVLLFMLDRRIVFEAIDVRPYAFALLVTTLAIYCFLRWLKTSRLFFCVMFGLACGGIFYFHYLYGCILVAFVISCWMARGRLALIPRRQWAVAAGCFALVMIPVWTRLVYLQQTRNAHVFADTPRFRSFARALAPGGVPFLFLAVAVIALLLGKLGRPSRERIAQFLVCATLAFVPIAILYGITLATPLHIFVERYEAVAVPGIALAWACLMTLVDSRALRLSCGVALAMWAGYGCYTAPRARLHGFTWKNSLQAADANAARDGAPILMCSDLPEADFETMPRGAVSESALFSPLSYYRVRAKVIPMPRMLNDQARRIGISFLSEATQKNERFLALGFRASYPTLRWLEGAASAAYETHLAGDFDGIQMIEFNPRDAAHHDHSASPK
ncbi:MAG TPA: glycosyltransferase family 39 protein [Candidatus Sulfotelmatobacter sp.]|nr:glycosyltransferase family 39 protein [Candidatus Sulfotelmatobacter sp.]